MFAAIEWGTQRSVIDNDLVVPVDLGTAGQLADPVQRGVMATRARYAEVVQGNLRRAAQEISGRHADLVRQRMTLTNLVLDWDETLGEAETGDQAGREAAGRSRDTALHAAVDRAIEAFPLDRNRRTQLRATFMTAGAAATRRAKAAGRGEPEAASASPRVQGHGEGAGAPQDSAVLTWAWPAGCSLVRGVRRPVHPVGDQQEARVRGLLPDLAQPPHRSELPRPAMDRAGSRRGSHPPGNPGAAAYRRRRAVMAEGSSGRRRGSRHATTKTNTADGLICRVTRVSSNR
ncbi:hypothetical protein ACPCUK_36325 [Streptomyces arboris]|uniref:hypothetical protein n=1 Tax=Streptomyces arboris TaxID=2600619 RepID=UPI003C2D9984